MIKRSNGFAALSVAALLTLAACSGTANISVPNATINANAQDAFNVSDSSLNLKSVVGNDATPYRATMDDASTGNWIMYYYSPSKQKSYRCTEKASDKTIIDITEITDVNLVYKPNYNIQKSEIKIDANTAKQKAVTAAANANANVSVGTTGSTGGGGSVGATANASAFTQTQVISAQECKDQTGKDVSAPVYVVASATVSVKVYVNASTGDVVATVNASATSTSNGTGTATGTATGTVTGGTTTTTASPTPAPTPTPMPSTAPSAAPTTTTSGTASGTATTTTM